MLKEGKATRTYIEGLERFFTDIECKEIGNKIKKKLSIKKKIKIYLKMLNYY